MCKLQSPIANVTATLKVSNESLYICLVGMGWDNSSLWRLYMLIEVCYAEFASFVIGVRSYVQGWMCEIAEKL